MEKCEKDRRRRIELRVGTMLNLLKKAKIIRIIYLTLLVVIISSCQPLNLGQKQIPDFDANRAYHDVEYQLSLGPRIPGSEGHRQVLEWMQAELEAHQWHVIRQEITFKGKDIINLIASRGEGEYILLGAHYDSRIYADQDPDPGLRKDHVAGANDSGSGVAVLLELARILPQDLPQAITLVFFDAEDNGGIDDWEWIMGSTAFVQELTDKPSAAVIVDMIGDADLEVYYERNSDLELMEEIWQQARLVGYEDVFIQEYRHSMLDDHTPFVNAGIPAVDLIDFDYPYWHTTSDTLDKVSPESLRAIGETLLAWLVAKK